MSKTKVIQVIDSLRLGGAETIAVNISNALVEKKLKSYLCVTRVEGPLKQVINPNVDYFFLNRNTTFGFNGYLKFVKHIKKHKIEVIHAHSTSIFLCTIAKILMGRKLKLIWHIHTGAYANLKGPKLRLYQFCSYWMNGIISVNTELLTWSKRFPVRNRIELHNFPIFINEEKETHLKGKDRKRIVCLAGMRKEKDHLTLLKAFQMIRNNIQNWTLHIIGSDYKNSYSKKIYRYVSENQLEDRVFFYGGVRDVKFVLEQSDIGVLSSKNEGFPVSILEYGFAKLAILTTNVGQLREIVQDKRVLAEPDSVKEYAEKLKNLINNSKFRREISQNFHKRVITNYSREGCMKKLERIYNS